MNLAGNLKAPTVAAAIAAPLSAYLATLIVWLINGVSFHCWIDPEAVATAASATTAVWTCPMHLPDSVTTAIQGIITLLGTGLAGTITHSVTENGKPPTP